MHQTSKGAPISTVTHDPLLLNDLLVGVALDRGWETSLERLARLSGSDSIALQVLDYTSGRCRYCRCHQGGDDGVARCGSSASGSCLWTAARQEGAGFAVIELWQEDGCGGHLILRSRTDGSAVANPAAALEPHLPVLRLASKLAWRLASQARHLDLLGRVIDQHSTGLLLIAAGRQVEFCNQPARTLLASNDGLALTNGALGATQSRADEALQSRLETALAAPGVMTPAEPGFLSIPRPSGKAAYRVVVVPLRAGAPGPVADPVAAVFIADPSVPTAATAALLQAFFQLTPREAEIAVALVQGATVAEAAAHMEISANTARVHLQGLFRKTGTHRQVDLLRALAMVPGVALGAPATGQRH